MENKFRPRMSYYVILYYKILVALYPDFIHDKRLFVIDIYNLYVIHYYTIGDSELVSDWFI